MQDLEDLDISAIEGTRQPLLQAQVQRHLKRSVVVEPPTGCKDANLPENCSIWVKTFGCAHNMSDSEFMAGQLQDHGFRQAPWPMPTKLAKRS